jgi:para-nitrobenzyl esterase
VEQGWLQGAVTNGAYRFLGVPFAQPPIGELRWRPPVPPQPWKGGRDATRFGPCAEQAVATPPEVRVDLTKMPATDAEILRQRWGVISDMQAYRSEDCLYLNVWSRTLDRRAKQPVMVWIHGGGNLRGAGSEAAYDGAAFAASGITLVTINYRLGAFGYLADPRFGTNFGLLDQVAALRWVQANVDRFGGDPGNVTVFGESAGAADIRSLLASPQAKGLFHRAALESAGFETPANGRAPSYERSARATQLLFDALGTRDPSELRQRPAGQIVAESMKLAFVPPGPGEMITPANLVWMPISDGATMLEPRFPAWSKDVPLLLGFNANESRYFLRPQIRYTRELLEAMAKAFFPGKAEDALAQLVPYGEDHQAALEAIFTAAIFTEPGLQMARRFAEMGGAVYAYHFKRVSPGNREIGKFAQHTAEIRYLFANMSSESGDRYDDVDVRLSREMHKAWCAFASSGVPKFADGQPWPQFSWPENRVALFDSSGSTAAVPLEGFNKILDSLRA